MKPSPSIIETYRANLARLREELRLPPTVSRNNLIRALTFIVKELERVYSIKGRAE